MIDKANFERIQRRIKRLAAEGKIVSAQGTKAQRAETPKSGSVHESAVPEGNAP